jgi:hypothetical protein
MVRVQAGRGRDALGTTPVSTTFTVPAGLGPGNYSLVVIANGIPTVDYPVSII